MDLNTVLASILDGTWAAAGAMLWEMRSLIGWLLAVVLGMVVGVWLVGLARGGQ